MGLLSLDAVCRPGYESNNGLSRELGFDVSVQQARELQLPCLLAIVQPGNSRSIGLLERLGFHCLRTQPATADDCELLVFGYEVLGSEAAQ